MPVADSTFGWQEAAIAFAILLIAAFLVTWVLTDLMRVRRAPYIAILLALGLGLGGLYLGRSGTPWTELVTSNWGWGVLAGVIAAGVAFPLVRRLPAGHRSTGAHLGEALLWEGVVYGVAEGVLLATLPVLALWQMAFDLGWTGGGWTNVGAGAIAIGGAILVVLAHHLGYREFRRRDARPKLLGAMVTCGLQAVAFLLTGSLLAPVVAHIVLHGQMLLRGAELPPVNPRAAYAS
jgi:hypothetical protein